MKNALLYLIVIVVLIIGCADDMEVPSVSIVSPQHGTVVSGVVDVIAEAEDNMGVEKVEFYFNDTLTSVVSIEPYVYEWDTTDEPDSAFFTIHAKAYDASDNEGVSGSVTVMVDN